MSVYFDNAATTPLDPRVRDAMLPWLQSLPLNPSSLHAPGRRARAAVDEARGRVAALLGARPDEIVFTASGTESDNLALRGVFEDGVRGGHAVVSAFEHPAVLETCRWLERRGVAVTRVAPEPEGIVDPQRVAAALRSDTRLVSVMAANNVIGTLQPIAELARVAHDGGALFHTDAVQAAGKLPLDVARLEADLLSMSAHKLYGPPGVGALFVRSDVELSPVIHGGGQEQGLRSATENTPGIVGFGVAAAIASECQAEDASRLVRQRDRLIDGVLEAVPGAYLVGDRWCRLPGHACFGIRGHENDAIRLLLELDARGIAVSSGSACSAHHAGAPSAALESIGFDPVAARGALRVTLGRFTTDDDVEFFLRVLPAAVAGQRSITSR